MSEGSNGKYSKKLFTIKNNKKIIKILGFFEIKYFSSYNEQLYTYKPLFNFNAFFQIETLFSRTLIIVICLFSMHPPTLREYPQF